MVSRRVGTLLAAAVAVASKTTVPWQKSHRASRQTSDFPQWQQRPHVRPARAGLALARVARLGQRGGGRLLLQRPRVHAWASARAPGHVGCSPSFPDSALRHSCSAVRAGCGIASARPGRDPHEGVPSRKYPGPPCASHRSLAPRAFAMLRSRDGRLGTGCLARGRLRVETRRFGFHPAAAPTSCACPLAAEIRAEPAKRLLQTAQGQSVHLRLWLLVSAAWSEYSQKDQPAAVADGTGSDVINGRSEWVLVFMAL